MIDGRLPEAVGGEFIDASGLGGRGRTRTGPRIVIGWQAFDENETLAHLYAAALRGAGFRVSVRPAGGLRPETVKAFKAGRIDAVAGIHGLAARIPGRVVAAASAREVRCGAAATSPAEDRNAFVIKREWRDTRHQPALRPRPLLARVRRG